MEYIYSAFAALPFGWSSYAFMVNALLGVILAAPLLGIPGTMAVNNKMAFFSDALGHSALTGIAIGVILGVGNMMISMIAFGILLAVLIVRVKSAETSSADTVISVFSSSATALGLVVLSIGGGFSKYSQYLIGDILAITPREILMLLIALVCVIAVWAALYNKLMLVSINTDLAASRGIRYKLVETAFAVLVAVVVMISIKWVGVMLINSLLILPAAAARNIAKSSKQHLALTVTISEITGIGGLIASYYLGSSGGATIVLAGAVAYFATLIAGKARQ